MSLSKFFFSPKHKPIFQAAKDKTRITQHLSLGAIKLHCLFDIEKFSTKIFIVCLISIFIGVYNFFILERTGLYSLGINSVFQSIARCVSYFLRKSDHRLGAKAVHTILFWGMTLVMNIPLSILGFRKIGRKFTILTIINIFVSSMTSMLLASLPESWGLKNFHIFSDPRTFNTNLLDKGIQILQWNHITTFKVNGNESNSFTYSMNDSSRVFLIFVYGVTFGLLNTLSSIVIYSLGGSSGGMDWVIYYYNKRKRKRLNSLYFYMSILLTFIAYLVGTYAPFVDYMAFSSSTTPPSGNGASGATTNGVQIIDSNLINNRSHSVFSNLIGPMFIATVVAALIRRIMYFFFYPSFKIITVKIYTNKIVELRRQLISSQFPQSFTINIAVGGYKLRTQAIFDVTCFALDLKMLQELAKSIDPTCLVIASPVNSLMGRFVVQDKIN